VPGAAGGEVAVCRLRHRETAFWCLVAIVEQLPGATRLVGPHRVADLAQHDDQEEGRAMMELLRLASPKVS
jgi:hypothetical protein